MVSPAWRLIVDGPVEGAMNMAVDRAVARGRAEDSSPPTLRLYGWEVPTVTLGRFQSLEDVDLAETARRGFDVVRRPTGGRGVLHADELTYSVVAGIADGVPRGVAASYRYFSAVLAEAYARLGVGARVTARPRGVRGAGACYLHASTADLSLGATKLSGSAQLWTGDTVLQHGSFVVSRDVSAESAVFRLDDAGADALAARTSTLEGVLGGRPGIGELVEAVAGAFEDVLGVSLSPGPATALEIRRALDMAPEHRIAVADR